MKVKTYKLKKDLPTFNVGDKFFISRYGGLWKYDSLDKYGEPKPLICAYSRSILEEYPNILKDWFEEFPEQQKTIWDLKKGDGCWMINDIGEIRYSIWYGDEPDNMSRDYGVVFLTIEEAGKELARRKTEVILRRDTKGVKPNYKQQGFCVYWDHDSKKLKFDDCIYLDGTIRFATYEDAEASIKAHEKEWKIYLGVED